jgi:hypothetical protein
MCALVGTEFQYCKLRHAGTFFVLGGNESVPSHGRVNGSEIPPALEPSLRPFQEFGDQRLRQKFLRCSLTPRTRPRPHPMGGSILCKLARGYGGKSPNRSERFHFLRHDGLSGLWKNAEPKSSGAKLDGLHGPYLGPAAPPTNRPQRRGGFSLGLVRGDRSGCLRNSSATECSRCPLSLFAGPAWRPALLRRGR